MQDHGHTKSEETEHKSPLSISVFFPCCNEEAAVEPLTQKTLAVLQKLTDDFEIIIVDDGSTDQTAQIADKLAAEIPQVKVIHHDKNLGYGSALQSGFKATSKQLVFYTDGDAQFDINELPPLLPLMEQYDIVSCYRINRREGLIRKFNAFCWTKLICMLFGLRLKDIDCAFKLYKRSLFDNIKLESTGALIDTEILAKAARKGYSITQRPVHHYPRQQGASSGSNPAVIIRAFKELFKLRKKILTEN
jgi:glycosyltransferase involved in cell wall biosynthesis